MRRGRNTDGLGVQLLSLSVVIGLERLVALSLVLFRKFVLVVHFAVAL